MTQTVNTPSSIEQSAPGLSGVDLARVALHQARAAAKARGEGGTRKVKRRSRTTAVRRDGREPTGFAAVLQGLMADRAWDVPAAGGSILDQWPTIAANLSPNLPAHVAAVAFHPESGQLDLRPDSSAYATQLRLIAARIVAAANERAGTTVVRTIRVLTVGTGRAPRDPDSAPAAVPKAPVKTREKASEGFRRALAAHQAITPARRENPGITQAAERQTRAMREVSQRAFPEPRTGTGNEPIPIDVAQAQRRREAAAIRAAALRRARSERAGATTSQGPAQAFGKSA